MVFNRKNIFTNLFFLFLCITGNAQYNCIFEHYSTENGLSHGSVSGMLKDQRGFMWFATWDGINRFDGNTFRTYKISDDQDVGYFSNRFETLLEDRLGNIWIMNYDSKVFRLNRMTEHFDNILGYTNSGDNVQVASVVPTSNGDVWLISSGQGVFRVVSRHPDFQYEVQHFGTSEKYKLSDNNVRFVAEDSLKSIWISTKNGVSCYESQSGSSELKPISFSSETEAIFGQYCFSAFYASSTSVFLGTTDGDLIVFRPNTQKVEVFNFGNTSKISVLEENRNGKLFIGTSGNGIFEFDLKTETINNHFIYPFIENVLKIFIDSHGLVWVESATPGFSKIDPQTKNCRHYQQELDIYPDVRPFAQCGLQEDKEQTVWLTLKGGGFGYYDRKTDEVEYFYNKPGDANSKISNFVYCFYKDSSDVLWISTYFKGIEKVTFLHKRFHFVQPSPQSNLSISNEVRSVMEDSKGMIWVGTKKQELFLLDKNFHVIKKWDSLNGEKIGNVYAIFEDSKGDILLGTRGNGLFVLQQKGMSDFKTTHFLHNSSDNYSISNDNIYSIIEDNKGRVWIGTYGGGLNIFEDNRFINSGNQLKNYPDGVGKKVRYIAFDNKGNLWLATTDGILYSDVQRNDVSAFSFKHFSNGNGTAKGLKGNDIYWVYCDKQGAVWVSSLGGGLGKVENDPAASTVLEFSTLTKENGLPSDVIFTITSDQNNNLWMSTENGVAFYNPEEQVFRNYNESDGIINSFFSEGACSSFDDKTICFGANNGLYTFDPLLFESKQRKIDLVLTGFQLFNSEVIPGENSPLRQSITETKTLRLVHNQNVISFSWAGLDFNMQDKIRYAYKLEGFDSDWHHVKNQQQASYTKIPPGKYTFTVKFDNPDLQEQNTPVALSVEILPPFWKTTWAYITYLIVFIAIVAIARRIITTMIRLRNRVVIEKELTNIKLNFFTNISHELRTPLTLILGPLKELTSKEEMSSNGKIYTHLIEQNAQRLLRLVNQLLDFRKIEKGKMKLSLSDVDLVEFIKSVCRNFDQLAREKQVHFSIHTNVSALNVKIDEEKIDSVIFNLLSNAFKFTPDGGTIDVSTSYRASDGQIIIEVKDNGVGVPKEHENSLFSLFTSYSPTLNGKFSSTGIGLALSKELVELHQGKLTYRPAEGGGGAIFSVVLKTDPLLLTGALPQVNETQNEYELPLTKVPVQAEILKKGAGHWLPRILVVDDNPDLRSFLTLQLKENFQVQEAENGRHGLAKALELQPDIILSDVMMPEMDGIELLDSIKNNFETSHIPVVLLTARSSVESKIEGLRYGADAYMTKPFDSGQLKAQLDNLLHQRTILRERYAHHQTREEEKVLNFVITEKDSEFLTFVRSIIEENLVNSDFKIEDIYKSIGMGRSKFFDKMKGLTGLSPIDFVKEFRLNKAVSLLQTGQYNITEVSYMSGFTDAGYFSKCFKEHFGTSPSHYIKKDRE